MASNRHTPRLVRLAVVSAISSLTVGLLSGTGHAAPVLAAPAAPVQPVAATPKTASEAAAKVEQLSQQLEILSEDINGAQVKLTKLRQVANTAKAQAKVADDAYAKLSDEVGKIVRTTYTSAPFGQFTTLMTSDSPSDFLAQLATLERMSEQRARVIGSVLKAKVDRDKSRDQAVRAVHDVSVTYTAAVTKKHKLDTQITVYRSLYQKLTVAERNALLGTASRGGGHVDISNLPPPPNPKAQIAVQTALAQQGKPYVWGAAGPATFDCSGLMMYAWAAAGVSLPHQSAQQYGYGTRIQANLGTLKPGDLLFFYSPIHHVAMYIGNGLQVHAPNTGDVVKVAQVDWGNLVGATRL